MKNTSSDILFAALIAVLAITTMLLTSQSYLLYTGIAIAPLFIVIGKYIYQRHRRFFPRVVGILLILMAVLSIALQADSGTMAFGLIIGALFYIGLAVTEKTRTESRSR